MLKNREEEIRGEEETNLVFLNPYFLILLYIGFAPPTDPGIGLPRPVRDFCPLCPLFDVLPTPVPIPLPILIFCM